MKIFIIKSLYAGIFIGIGAIVYMINPGIVGAVLFTIGLFGCINNRLNLFTGKVGYESHFNATVVRNFTLMILANVAGIALISGLFYAFAEGTMAAMLQTADKIVGSRLTTNYLGLFVGAIGCGMLMSHAVDRPTRSDDDFNNVLSYIPLLYCVPVFIMSCFPHCIADIGYYTVYTIAHGLTIKILPAWLVCVAGNIVGCQIMGRLARKLLRAK